MYMFVGHKLLVHNILLQFSMLYLLCMQTWDLHRIMYYGFKAFATDYLGRHPRYYINPHDVNGSVIETIFSQMRHTAQQNLTASNYAWTRASLLSKWSLSGKRGKRDDYRKQPLHFKQTELRRRK